MTDVEEAYTKNLKYNAFMGTIAVCVIYAIVAIIMILYINLTDQGKTLYSELKPFALTFIFGTLIIILTTTILVLYWKPEQAKKLEINDVLQNPYSCPDYYKLEETLSQEKTMISNMSFNLDNSNMGKKYKLSKDLDFEKYKYTDEIKHKCVNDTYVIDNANININTTKAVQNASSKGLYKATAPSITEIGNIKLVDDISTADTTTTNLIKTNLLDKIHSPEAYASFSMMYGGISSEVNKLKVATSNLDNDRSFKIDCAKVYPDYLAQIDAQYYIDNPESGVKNKHRCEWSKRCGVPWGSAGCS
jgi:hypothetical protein